MDAVTVKLAGGCDLHATRLEREGEPVVVLARSFEGPAAALLDGDTPRVVLPASALIDLRDALVELED